jgi:hypothetical protein
MQLLVELTATRSMCVAHDRAQGGALAAIIHERRSAVRIDVIDLVRH